MELLEPSGPRRADARAALIARTFLLPHIKQGRRAPEISEFMLQSFEDSIEDRLPTTGITRDQALAEFVKAGARPIHESKLKRGDHDGGS